MKLKLRQINKQILNYIDIRRNTIRSEMGSARNNPKELFQIRQSTNSCSNKSNNFGIQKFRLVVNYRRLNEITLNDKFPLPNIDSLLDKLGRAQYFPTIDPAKGYHQILVKEEDHHKTAFVTPYGLYQFVRMPFGLENSPAPFQLLINKVLTNYINKTCVVYLDDVLIFSTSLRKHIQSLPQIFRAHNLKIQMGK